MPPSVPTHGVGPAPRHGAGGTAGPCARSAAATIRIPNAAVNADLHRMCDLPPASLLSTTLRYIRLTSSTTAATETNGVPRPNNTKENRDLGLSVSSLLMPTPRALPKIRRRRSSVHGFGVFALEAIAKNTRIIDYAGELVRTSESEAREERDLAEGCVWVFRVNRTWSRDAAVGGNLARFINHACRPNCWFEVADRTIWIRASRLIRKGEELTYDYATVGERTIPCRCRPGCGSLL